MNKVNRVLVHITLRESFSEEAVREVKQYANIVRLSSWLSWLVEDRELQFGIISELVEENLIPMLRALPQVLSVDIDTKKQIQE